MRIHFQVGCYSWGLLLPWCLVLSLILYLNPQQYFSIHAWIEFVIEWNCVFLLSMSLILTHLFIRLYFIVVFVSRLWFRLLWLSTYILCCCFEFPFIFWIRFCFGRVWKNKLRLSTSISCAFYQFTFLWETCLVYYSVGSYSFFTLLFSFLKFSCFMYCDQFFSYHNHCAGNFSLCLLPILST